MDKRRQEEEEDMEEDEEMWTLEIRKEEEEEDDDDENEEIAGTLRIWKEKIKGATEAYNKLNGNFKKNVKAFTKDDLYGENEESVKIHIIYKM